MPVIQATRVGYVGRGKYVVGAPGSAGQMGREEGVGAGALGGVVMSCKGLQVVVPCAGVCKRSIRPFSGVVQVCARRRQQCQAL